MKALSLAVVACATAAAASGAWENDGTSLTWREGDHVVWRFNADPALGKPYFHPLSIAGKASLTGSRPADHWWHYGLWFSWKFINGVNYWEEQEPGHKAKGATHWAPPEITTRPDGSATLRLKLEYVAPDGHVEMTEQRGIEISAASAENYTIDWTAQFQVGDRSVTLERVPMMGEPKGQVSGGYGGFSYRAPLVPSVLRVVSTQGPVTNYVQDRARPTGPALGCNIDIDDRAQGGLAILTDSANFDLGENAPWYVVNAANGFRWACSAILAPKVVTLQPGTSFALRYRVVVRAAPWTPEALKEAWTAWRSAR